MGTEGLMAEYHLTTPFQEDEIRSLNVGDVVRFDGTLFGIRDLTQIYMFDGGNEPPVSLAGFPCLHTAPSLRRRGERWEPISVGTTTSTRMERFTPPLIERYGVRAIIGKGGLLVGSLAAMQQHGAVYLAIPGGVAAYQTTTITEVTAVHWEHLHPEALYEFRVTDFGPLIVAMDSHGDSLYDRVRRRAADRLSSILSRLA